MTPLTDRVERALFAHKDMVYRYIMSEERFQRLKTPHLRDAVSHALGFGGKSLRPALLLYSCGAVAGEIAQAIPAAAAVEMYHTWTLIHDDVIDRDATRRGHATIHEEFRRRAVQELGYSQEEAQHYGVSLAILAGDILQGWATSALCELVGPSSIRAEVALHLAGRLTTNVQDTLVEGETLDIQYAAMAVEDLDEEQILEMLRKKTAVLYEFAAQAGAMIALNQPDPDVDIVREVGCFASECGLAFQLRDDILGVVGNEQTLGKPVGSDLKEGKKTIIVRHVLMKANRAQRERIEKVLGNQDASPPDIAAATALLVELGGVERAQTLAVTRVENAMRHLNNLPQSAYKQMMIDWGRYLVDRDI
ncbi:MAG: polyprenyl synthetase family protein [Chloroflexi bacterium]|nr:polyprenyl synthetase family protein [Chloroflexota bacterium]